MPRATQRLTRALAAALAVHGRMLKLVGGGVMLALAITLLVRPELMDDLTGMLLVFGAAFAGIGLVLLHRVILPRVGVFVGSEKRPKKRPRRDPENL